MNVALVIVLMLSLALHWLLALSLTRALGALQKLADSVQLLLKAHLREGEDR